VLRNSTVKPASFDNAPVDRRPQESDIVEIRTTPRGGPPSVPSVRSFPSFAGFPRAARTLAEAARDHFAAGEMTDARRAAEDALLVIDTIGNARDVGEVSLVLGDVLLGLYEGHRARERFAAAVVAFDEKNDLASAARARLGLARAMLMLRDPAARTVLEDAGTIFEELGDEPQVLAVDRALREADADLEGCPTSLHVSLRYA
jgi:hypothetical protein